MHVADLFSQGATLSSDLNLSGLNLLDLNGASGSSLNNDTAADWLESPLIRSNQLRRAAMEGNHKAVERAIKGDADEESVSCATRKAVLEGDVRMVRMLAKNDVNGRHGAIVAVSKGNFEVAKVFFDRGVDPSVALWYAGVDDDFDMVEKCISAGFDCRAALNGALQAQKYNIVSVCMNGGVSCEQAFMSAVGRDDVDTIDSLIGYAVPHYGEALKLALEHSRLRTARLLLEEQADRTLALEHARGTNNQSIMTFLADFDKGIAIC